MICIKCNNDLPKSEYYWRENKERVVYKKCKSCLLNDNINKKMAHYTMKKSTFTTSEQIIFDAYYGKVKPTELQELVGCSYSKLWANINYVKSLNAPVLNDKLFNVDEHRNWLLGYSEGKTPHAF